MNPDNRFLLRSTGSGRMGDVNTDNPAHAPTGQWAGIVHPGQEKVVGPLARKAKLRRVLRPPSGGSGVHARRLWKKYSGSRYMRPARLRRVPARSEAAPGTHRRWVRHSRSYVEEC